MDAPAHALPRLVANSVANAAALDHASSNAALDRASAGNVAAPDDDNDNARMEAGRAVKRFRMSADLHDMGLVTTSELGDQFAYATGRALAASSGILGVAGIIPAEGAPAWAVALAAQTNAQITALGNQMNVQFNQMNVRFDHLDARLSNAEARLVNVTASSAEDPIRPIANADGFQPPVAIFPVSFGALICLSDDDAEAVLAHYQLPADPLETRVRRLRKFLGAWT